MSAAVGISGLWGYCARLSVEEVLRSLPLIALAGDLRLGNNQIGHFLLEFRKDLKKCKYLLKYRYTPLPGLPLGPPWVDRNRDLCFVTGQPLGLYSSWPLFTLSHHFVVWLAAEKVKPGIRFRNYAILGDDVVIGDREVALAYRDILDKLGVTISTQKYIISTQGAFEFAKRFCVKRVTIVPYLSL